MSFSGEKVSRDGRNLGGTGSVTLIWQMKPLTKVWWTTRGHKTWTQVSNCWSPVFSLNCTEITQPSWSSLLTLHYFTTRPTESNGRMYKWVLTWLATLQKAKRQKTEKRCWVNGRKNHQPLPVATVEEGTPGRAYESELSHGCIRFLTGWLGLLSSSLPGGMCVMKTTSTQG